MDNSLPFEVVFIGGVYKGNADFHPVLNKKYIVESVWEDPFPFTKVTGQFYQLREGGKDNYYHSSLFRRISPYQNSVSRSLAEQALKDKGDSRQDMVPERKEVEV